MSPILSLSGIFLFSILQMPALVPARRFYSSACCYRNEPNEEQSQNWLLLKQQAKTTLSDRVLHFRFENESSERLDKFLVEQLPEFSRSRIQGLISDGHVDVNDLAAKKAGQTLESGFNVTVRIPPTVSSGLIAEDIPLDVLFENDDLLVV